MRLLFWKKKAEATPVPTTVAKKVPRPSSQPRPTTKSTFNPDGKTSQARVVELKRAASPNSRALITLKLWCDENLNPLAWSRIVIRMLPVFRDFGQNLSEMQKPKSNTYVEHDLYLLVLATIQEIYGVEPQLVQKKRLA
jgi:hypothetical protein